MNVDGTAGDDTLGGRGTDRRSSPVSGGPSRSRQSATDQLFVNGLGGNDRSTRRPRTP